MTQIAADWQQVEQVGNDYDYEHEKTHYRHCEGDSLKRMPKA
jgi:hypothetical protein